MDQDNSGKSPGHGERTAADILIPSRGETSHLDMRVKGAVGEVVLVAQGGSRRKPSPVSCSSGSWSLPHNSFLRAENWAH